MRFSGQISDFALGSGLIQRTRLTALYSRSTGDTHLRLLPHTPSRANQRLASLWTSRGAPQQCTCLLGVEFPLSGPQVWTFTSCSLLMPDTLLLRGLWPGFTLDAAAPPTPASTAACLVGAPSLSASTRAGSGRSNAAGQPTPEAVSALARWASLRKRELRAVTPRPLRIRLGWKPQE